MKTLTISTIGNRVLAGNEYADAHSSGFYDGLQSKKNFYPVPINDYQKEYNRGYKSGRFLSR